MSPDPQVGGAGPGASPSNPYLCNRSRGKILAREVIRMVQRWGRARMLFLRRFAPEVGLLFPDMDRLHTLGSLQRVDVLFFDEELRVASIHRDLGPWRLIAAPAQPTSLSALVAHAGRLSTARVQEGDLLEWLPPTSERIALGARPWCEDLLPSGLRIDIENRTLYRDE